MKTNQFFSSRARHRFLLLMLLTMFTYVSAWGATATLNASCFGSNVSNYSTSEASITDANSNTWKVKGYGMTKNTNVVIGKAGANYLQTPNFSGNISKIVVTCSGSYYLKVIDNSGLEVCAQQAASGGTLTFNVSGSYKQLKLYSKRYSSESSNAATTITQVVVTYGSSCTKVDAPTVTATPGNTRIDLQWAAVSHASTYSVTCKNKSTGVAAGTVGSVSGSGPYTCAITGLTNGTEYTWSVMSVGDGSTYCDADNDLASGDATPNVYYTVTWNNNGSQYTTTSVVSGSKPTFPDAPTSCDAGEGASTTFYGWSTSTWSGKINDISAKTIYTSAASMPTVTGNGVVYHAVFCKGGGGSVTITNKMFTDALSASYSTVNITSGVYTFEVQACKQDNKCQMRDNATLSYIAIPTLPGVISRISTTVCANGSGGSYTGTLHFKHTKTRGNADTNDIAKLNCSSGVTSFDWDLSSNTTYSAGYLLTSAGLRLQDLTIYYGSGGTNYMTTCCTDWSTPTVSYSSSLAINASEGVTIGSGTTHGAVTYESSDEDVLTVTSDGTITAVGAGTAHIIATWAGADGYCPKSANSNDVTVSGIMVTGTTPVNFGQVYQNAVVANKTISVTGINLASVITPSLPAGSPFSFSPNTLAANSSGATLTISASTATLGNYNQTLTLTSGAFSTTVTVKMEVIAMPSCEFVDNLHNLTVDASSVPLSSYALTAAQGTAVVFPTLANQVKGASTCEDQHYRFVGWTTSDNNTDPEDHLVTSHTLANGDDITYYAVWADGVAGVSYTKLTSSTFKTSPTTYVIGAEYSSSTYYFYSCAVTDANNSWGVCSTDPSTDAPIQFTLSGTASALVATSTEGTARYLNPASGKQFFGMSATSKTVVLGASGTIESSADSYNLLRYNYNSGSGGLRWYSSETGEPAYFYEVVAGSTPSYRTSCCANKVEAPTVTATKTSTSITLTWDDETGATGWEVSWNGGAFGSPSGTRTHTVSGLTPNTTYTWQVRATYDPLVKCGVDIASGSTTTNQVYHVTYAKGDGEANCNATGSTTDATGYEAGATVTLQANGFTLSGYIFNAWTEDDPDVTISSNQFTMPDHDVVITASWTAKVDKYFDRMHDQTDASHGGVVETSGPNEGKYYILMTGCNYSVPTAVDRTTGDACQTSHYKLQGWIAASYVASDGTITPANLAAHLFPPTGTKTATGATYYAVWAEVTE